MGEGECRKMLEQMRRDVVGYSGKVLLTNPAKVTSDIDSASKFRSQGLKRRVHTVPHISNNLSHNPVECLKINLDTKFFVKEDVEKFYRQCGRVNPITQFLFVTEVWGWQNFH